ncbi:MAG: hypothetical protein ACI85H_000789 [Paracoccaceae bacterium]
MGCKINDEGFSYGGILSIFTPYANLKPVYEMEEFYLVALSLAKKLSDVSAYGSK